MIDIGHEVGSGWTGDTRIEKRLYSISRAISKSPAKSFPKIFTQSDELEAFYRLLRNENVSWREIFSSHVRRTCERIDKEEGEVLSISDSTLFSFRRENGEEDIGYVGTSKEASVLHGGFLGHFALAVTLSGKPLGIIGLEPIRRKKSSRKKPYRENASDPTRESRKWWNLVEQIEQNTTARKIIHVMDAESDIYEFFSQMVKAEERFVVRMSQDRKVESSSVKTIYEALSGSEVVTQREVILSKRRKSRLGKSNRNVARSSRNATLSIRATSIEIKCPQSRKTLNLLPTIKLNVIEVFEQNPPEGKERVDWKLITTEPILNEEDILKVVDIYRKRWVIEEYFKALKTGCSFEKRELQSYKTLLNALAILIPVAYRLLLIRSLSRTASKEPASNVLTQVQLKILKSETKNRLSDNPTIKDALLAIAKIGGHIKNNGDPGWIVLGRGYEELLVLERGYAAAVASYEKEHCDM